MFSKRFNELCSSSAFSYFDPQGTRCLIDGADNIRAPKDFYTTDALTDRAIQYIDRNVGKLTDYLEKTKQLDNTLILFLSDNGACAEPYTEFGGGRQTEINDSEKSGAISYDIGAINYKTFQQFLLLNSAQVMAAAIPTFNDSEVAAPEG